jgi:autotransporter passenger strand-loop-strand repeat protein
MQRPIAFSIRDPRHRQAVRKEMTREASRKRGTGGPPPERLIADSNRSPQGSRSEFRIWKIHRAETRGGTPGLGRESSKILRQTGFVAANLRKCRQFRESPKSLASGAVSGNIVNGGLQTVYGTASGTTVSGGGEELVVAGATANGGTVVSGLQLVYGSASGTTVSSGGTEYIVAGGTGSSTKDNGGIDIVFGTDTGTMVNSGCVQYVYAAV